ncbi:MAG: ABC-F family ATPase, partial [Planctomycetaceae bacterium]
HLDLESIEALVAGLQNYDGTLILVSHDRWFVAQLATRVVEINAAGVRDYHGSYEEYVHACGDDHLDADAVLRAGSDAGAAGGKKGRSGNGKPGRAASKKKRVPAPDPQAHRASLDQRRDDLTAEIEMAEARIAEIDASFCQPGYYDRTPTDIVTALQDERAELEEKVTRLMAEWETVEKEVERRSS